MNDKSAVIENLRPNSAQPMTTSQTPLIIEYIPSVSKPIDEVKLQNPNNIRRYNVNFYNADGSVIKRTVSLHHKNGCVHVLMISCT